MPTSTKARRPARPDAPNIPKSLCLAALAPIEIEAASSDSEGATPKLPRFRMVAYTGGPMRIAGWRHPVIVDLAGLGIPSQSRPIRFSHDPVTGVGHTDVIRIEGGQLIATGIVSRDTPTAREVVVSSKNGFPWQASIGASVDEFEFVKENQKVLVNGREHVGPLNVVRKSTLGEISFVDLGADGQTSVNVAAKATASSTQQETSNMDDLNIQNNTNDTDAASAEATGAPQTSTHAAAAAPSLAAGAQASTIVKDIRAQAANETDRIIAIRRLCAGKQPVIEAQAIA